MTKESNVVSEVGNVGEESDGFGFFSEDHDLVNASDIECQSYFPTYHGTLQQLYEEYFQLLNMDQGQFERNSFAESLLE